MWLLAALVTIGVVACSGGEEPPPSRREKPEHPDEGAPDFEDAGDVTTGLSVEQAQEVEAAQNEFGTNLDLFVHATKEGQDGCGTIRLENILFEPETEGRNLTLSAQARWASFPPSFLNDSPVSLDVAYRSGDFPISLVTEEYPEYGTLGLKYLVTGTYDLDEHQLRILLQNIDTESGETTGIFLTPVYTSSDGDTCRAREDMGNEFFVATPATTEVTLDGTSFEIQ